MSSVSQSRIAKLRASCDACNESKVRCSQAKPRCARCEKHGIHCVYGLSRRSHKNAPRIGASHESAAAAAAVGAASAVVMSETPGPSSPSDPIPSSRGRSMTAPTPTSGSGSGSGSSDRSTSHAPAQGLASDAALSSLINMQSPPGRLYDDLAHNPDFGMSVSAGYDFLDQHMAGSGLDYPGMHAGFMDYDLPSEPDGGGMEGEREREMEREPAGSPSASCNCVSRLVEELGSLPSLSSSSSSTPNNGGIPGSSGGGGGGASFDAQLSQLRRAINVSADCLSCHCNTQDEMSIMTISLLMGRVIQSLDQTLLHASSISSSSSSSSYPPVFSSTRPGTSAPSATAAGGGGSTAVSTSTSTSGSRSTSTPVSTHTAVSASASASTPGPGLSWGSLQIDPHEEEQLKQHLWLLQFRKLERVIDEFSHSIGRLPAAGQSAHLMACRCLHMWLMQKAEGLRERYRTQDVGRDPLTAGSHV